jgi:general secretion pathway protein C
MKAKTVTRWATLAIWAGVAASALGWGLRLFSPGLPVPPHATSVSGAQALRGDPTLLLGRADDPEPVAADVPVAPSRFRLIGVLAPRLKQAAGEGVALIAIDDRPPRAYRVGTVVEGDLVLQRVHAGGADLGTRGTDQPRMALQAPPLVPAAAGAAAAPMQPLSVRRAPVARPMPLPMRSAVPSRPALEGEPDAIPEPDAAPDDEPDSPPHPGALTQ